MSSYLVPRARIDAHRSAHLSVLNGYAFISYFLARTPFGEKPL